MPTLQVQNRFKMHVLYGHSYHGLGRGVIVTLQTSSPDQLGPGVITLKRGYEVVPRPVAAPAHPAVGARRCLSCLSGAVCRIMMPPETSGTLNLPPRACGSQITRIFQLGRKEIHQTYLVTAKSSIRPSIHLKLSKFFDFLTQSVRHLFKK